MRTALKRIIRKQERAVLFFTATTIIGAAVCGGSVVALVTSPLWVPLTAFGSEPEAPRFEY